MTMRITDSMIFRQATDNISSQRQSLFSLQEQSATGYKFLEIADDPVGAERVRMLREAKEAASHYETNIDRSYTQLDSADTALAEATNVLIRAKEIALAMGSEHSQAPERAISANEVDSLFQSVVNMANTEAGGEYIFGGYAIGNNPFLADGTYVGDGNLKQVDVGPNTRIEVGVSGANAFTAAGGIDVFATLRDLETALNADDDNGIQTAIGDLDVAMEQINRARTDAGLKSSRLDVAENVRQTVEDSLTKEESSVIDIDPVETFMSLNETSKSLQEAMAVAQKVTQQSLLNHI